MGCGSSKAEEPPLVALCRERRELIRAAAQHRFALAAAHAAYFRALGRVGEALHRFVEEELVSAPASPILTLPPAQGKGMGKGKDMVEIRSDADSCCDADAAVGASAANFPSTAHSRSNDSCLHLPSDAEFDEMTAESSEIDGGGEGSSRSFSHQQYYGAPIPNYYYMKSAAPIASTTVYQTPYPAWSSTACMSYGYGYDYGYSFPMDGAPMDAMPPPPVQDDNFYYQNQPRMEDKPADPPPPPPPPAEESAWDFFNPFDSYEHMIPGYFQAAYGRGSATSSPNSSEVREKEGIPDLEEETEQESVKAPVKERKPAAKAAKDPSTKDTTKKSNKGADKDSAASAASEKGANDTATEQKASTKVDTVALQAKEESLGSCSVSKVEVDEKDMNTKSKSVSFRDEEASLATDDSRPSKESSLFVPGTRDVMEVVKEIKEHFESAANCGEEISKILEVGRLSYKSKNKILRVIFSRILNPLVPPVRSASVPPASSSSKMKKADPVVCENMDIDTVKLSSTLDKLYVWEKRLHKLVEEEERLRAVYEREWKQLKALDESGAESSKMEFIQASIRDLLRKLNIVIRSANHISKRINQLRDEELRPRLIELIQGSVKMWKSVLDCHRKQFQAIAESKSYNLVARTGSSVAKATMALETELLNWSSCFSNWFNAQKAYIEALNGWLLKWLLQEREETPDGMAPFSPGRLGAPEAFVITNDWHQSMDRISEGEVTDSMQMFALNLHQLWETQDEEQRQKLKGEYSSKEFARRLRSLQKEGVLPITNGDEAFHHDHRRMSLDSIKRRLEEERTKHEETIKQVQQATASNLRTGLVPIFQSLENFSSEALKGFEGVRISNAGPGT